MSSSKSDSKPIDKALCDWSKRDLRERFDQLQAIVRTPRFACTKCGRAAVARRWLCKPKPLE